MLKLKSMLKRKSNAIKILIGTVKLLIIYSIKTIFSKKLKKNVCSIAFTDLIACNWDDDDKKKNR